MGFFKRLPEAGKKLTEYSVLTGFLIGALLGLLVGKYDVIILLTAIAGIIVSHSKLSVQGFNTIYAITNLSFLLGMIIFTTAVKGLALMIVFGIGLLVGRFVKKRF
ncbi:MAG: hypothetical protein ACQESE_01030 [Nanobdellota archaeon]